MRDFNVPFRQCDRTIIWNGAIRQKEFGVSCGAYGRKYDGTVASILEVGDGSTSPRECLEYSPSGGDGSKAQKCRAVLPYLGHYLFHTFRRSSEVEGFCPKREKF